MANDDLRPWSRASLAAQALGRTDATTGAVIPPLHLSTTFLRDPDNLYRSGFVYGRPDNATVRDTEAVIAALEEADGGAMLFGSGMAAATACFLSLDPGSHVVAPAVMYWALRKWLLAEGQRLGLRVDLVETDRVEHLAAAVRPNETKMVWLETPSNPLWTISDIAAAAEIAHGAGAILAVDSTCASPFHTRPLALGADIAMHSATKILNGHSDVIAGVLAFARQDALHTRIAAIRSGLGSIVGPFEAYLLQRGLKTFFVRARAQAATAAILAERLSRHPGVSRVLYPGLPHHPGHDLAARQMENGFGFMLSVQACGGEAAAIRAAARVTLWKRATSLGGVESLIEHRASIEGPGTPCPADLLRLSAGLEDPADLFDDLDQALR